MINRPIRTEAEYKSALAEIDEFFRDEPRKGDIWERQHPIGPPHPVETIRHRMRTAGYTQTDLALHLGSPARASDVLQKKRRTPAASRFGLAQPQGSLARTSSFAHGRQRWQPATHCRSRGRHRLCSSRRVHASVRSLP